MGNKFTIPKGMINQTTTIPKHNTWQQYIDSLQDWERYLLRNLEEKQTTYGSLKVMMQLQEQIYLVTDGGLDNNIGYFRWVVATDQTILWENRGHAQGEKGQIETLRTKSVGLLAIMIFFEHYLKHNNILFDPNQVKHYCDNMGVVKRMKWHDFRKVLTPRECLLVDADVLLQIKAMYNDMEMMIPSLHVKGHQDRQQINKELTEDTTNSNTITN
eukprot:11534488-Ditylum_brightwellii.AAC.1